MSTAELAPITGLCIVSDPEKCPPGYELIYRTHDRKEECDLWKDGFFRTKITRYLCITRVFPLDGGRLNNVLADICILNEKEAPYPGFALLDKTQDGGEMALKKKVISVKMIPRGSAQDAVCDIIILSKNKRAPQGYSLIGGDINGLAFCYKLGTVPPESRRAQPESNLTQPPPLSTSGSFDTSVSLPNSYQSNHVAAVVPPVTKQDSVKGNAVHDVPFQLHTRFQDHSSMSDLNLPLNFRVKTLADIDNDFNYPFVAERSAMAGS